MQKQQLRRAIAELREELAQREDQIDDETKILLSDLVEDVDARLHGRGPVADVETRVEEAVVRFESTHPTLAGCVRAILSILNQTGI